jgi:hypothetical protein
LAAGIADLTDQDAKTRSRGGMARGLPHRCHRRDPT